MKTIVLVVLLAAAGCSKKSASASDCDAAIAKGTESLMATVKSRATNPQVQNSLTELVGKMRTTLTLRCNEDKWGPEVVDCFTKLTSQAEMQACESKLTNDQRTKLRNELRQVMSSMRMSTGGPGHPGTLGGSGAPDGESVTFTRPGAAAPPSGTTEPPPANATPPAPGGAAPPAPPPAAPASGAAPAAGSSASGW